MFHREFEVLFFSCSVSPLAVGINLFLFNVSAACDDNTDMNLIEFIYIFFPQAFQSHFQNGKENSYIVLSAREKMNLNWILGFISCCTDCEWEQEDSVSLPLSLHEIAHAEPVTARHENQAADC